jgi:hypothetical protein
VRVRKRMAGLVLGLAVTGALLAAGLAGCGGGAKANTAGTAATGAPSGGVQEQLQAYVSCLRQHGVNIDIPSGRPSAFGSFGARPRGSGRPTAFPSGDRSRGPGGGFGGGGFGGGFGGIFGNNGQPPAGVDQATWDSAQQACASTRPSFGPGGGAGRDNGAAAAYLNCLRDHGMSASTGPGRLNSADPAVAAAIQACAPLRPTGGPAPSSTG